eukprot:213452-Chlamydomonas_euryale.AAC.3
MDTHAATFDRYSDAKRSGLNAARRGKSTMTTRRICFSLESCAGAARARAEGRPASKQGIARARRDGGRDGKSWGVVREGGRRREG